MSFNRIHWGLLCLALFALTLCLGIVSACAQSTTQGAIAGTVEDPSGAVVGSASITIRNAPTNATVQVTSDGSGYFNAPLLEPGNYSVSVSAHGFASYRADNVSVFVGQVTSVSPHLALSSSTAEVVVTEQTPVMNLESPDFTDTLNQQALQSIPINNRRWSALAMTTPGVVADTSGFGLVSIRTTNLVKYLTNDWSLNDSFQMSNGLPYTVGVSGFFSTGILTDWNDASGSTLIPMIGSNTERYPRHIVDDVRLQKEIRITEGRDLQLMANVFNVANHQNVDGLGTTAYKLSGTTATYQGQGPVNPSLNTYQVPTSLHFSHALLFGGIELIAASAAVVGGRRQGPGEVFQAVLSLGSVYLD